MGCPRCGGGRKASQTTPTVVYGGNSQPKRPGSDPAADSSMGRARVEIMNMGLKYAPTAVTSK